MPSRRLRSIDDANQVAVAHLADRAAGQGLGADVADAGAGGDAGEAGVGEHGDVAAPRQDTSAPT